ncbi:MAG: type II secretion system protein J [Vulcanimicrobiota bacterium]
MINVKSRGISLIEVLVAGALMAIFMTMVGRALVLGFRTQARSSEKVQAVREATMALDEIARDVSTADPQAALSLSLGLPPTALTSTPTRADVTQEFRISGWHRREGYPGFPDSIITGYWFVPATATSPGSLRKMVYDSYSLSPLPSQLPTGKILVRDVREFLVSRQVVGGADVVRCELYVNQIGKPVVLEIGVNKPI